MSPLLFTAKQYDGLVDEERICKNELKEKKKKSTRHDLESRQLSDCIVKLSNIHLQNQTEWQTVLNVTTDNGLMILFSARVYYALNL